MPQKSPKIKDRSYIDKLSDSLGDIFHKLHLENRRVIDTLGKNSPEIKEKLQVHARRVISFESKLNSMLQLYKLDKDEFALSREKFSITDDLDVIVGNLKQKGGTNKTVVEVNKSLDTTEVSMNRSLFQKWLYWCIFKVYSDPAVIHVLINLTFQNGKILIRISPKRLKGKAEIKWGGLDYLLAEHFFSLEGSEIKQLKNGGVEIGITVIGLKFESASKAKDLEGGDILEKIRKGIDLPALSPVAAKVVSLATDENVSANKLAELISLDASLTARVLKVVNTPLYGFRKQITTLSQAVALMGMKAVRSVALCISILDAFPGKNNNGFNYNEFWQISISNAIACRLTANRLGLKIEEEAFIAGLTQNIGSLVFGKFLEDKYESLYSRHYNVGEELAAMEVENWGIDHTMLGYEVFSKWQMPVILAQAILYHHTPENVPEDNENLSLLVKLVYTSDLVSRVLHNEENTGINLHRLKEKYKEYFNLSGGDVDQIMEKVAGEVKTVANDFDFKVENSADYAEILQQANIELGKINLDYEQLIRDLEKAKNRAENLTNKLREVNKKLEEKAVKDGLTNLYNHRFFYEMLNKEFANARRHKRNLSCIMMDLDNFKKVNDTYGHQEGDAVLRTLGTILLDALREGDVAARYGGEEFALILSNTPVDEAFKVADRIRERVEKTDFTNSLTAGKITVSVGVAGFESKRVNKASELAELADRAVYVSKNMGKNLVTLFSKDMPEKESEIT